jgi:hypothetical protein
MPQTVRLPEAVSSPGGISGYVAGFNPRYGYDWKIPILNDIEQIYMCQQKGLKFSKR